MQNTLKKNPSLAVEGPLKNWLFLNYTEGTRKS